SEQFDCHPDPREGGGRDLLFFRGKQIPPPAFARVGTTGIELFRPSLIPKASAGPTALFRVALKYRHSTTRRQRPPSARGCSRCKKRPPCPRIPNPCASPAKCAPPPCWPRRWSPATSRPA